MKLAPTLAWQNIGDEVVLVDVKAGKLCGLNGAAGRIIEWINEGLEVEAMVFAMTVEFEVSPERASADIACFLAALSERGLVTP